MRNKSKQEDKMNSKFGEEILQWHDLAPTGNFRLSLETFLGCHTEGWYQHILLSKPQDEVPWQARSTPGTTIRLRLRTQSQECSA